MTKDLFDFFVLLGMITGLIAAVIAYLVTYNEYTRHYSTKQQPRKIALRSAIVAFIFFFAAMTIAGYFLIQYLNYSSV